MNEGVLPVLARLVALFMLVMAPAASAQDISYRHHLTAAERRCLAELIENGEWRYVPQTHQKMMSVAVVARARLDGNGREQFIYVMRDFSFCGTAGCSMLIGEPGRDGSCHAMYDGPGSDVAITLLRERDHGYRRLYTPCELRFDGHEYHQIHDECPTLDVQR